MQYNYENIPGLHPFFGFAITLSTFLVATFLPELNILLHYHLPPIMIELFQIFAYTGTGIVGIIAGYKFFKESVLPKLKKK